VPGQPFRPPGRCFFRQLFLRPGDNLLSERRIPRKNDLDGGGGWEATLILHAEPVTFGWKLCLLWDELRRGRERLDHAITDISVGKISGAVGTFAHVHPDVEAFVCARLNLQPAPASNQVVQRDRHAFFFNVLALIATTIEKIAV